MSHWTRRESWRSIRMSVAQIVELIGDRQHADVLDVAAGSWWIGQGLFRGLARRALDRLRGNGAGS